MKIYHELGSKNLCYRNAHWNTDQDFSFHWHEKIEILRCMNYGFDILIDGVNYTVNPGDIIVIGEKIIHKFKVRHNGTHTKLMQFPFRVLLKGGVLPKPVKPVITVGEISAVDGLEKQVENLFDLLENESLFDGYENEPIMENLFSALYFLLMRHFSCESLNSTSDKSKRDFYKIVGFVNDNFTMNINVGQIAKELYMDRGKMSNLFKKYSGIPLNQYINTLRMNKAKELMKQGYKVSEAALESGFQSIRTFNSVYRKSLESIVDNKG